MTIPFPVSLASDASYVSPAYLRTPFRSFLVSFDKGIYWLRMPADTGKTQFVRGIIAKRPAKDGTPEGIDSAISSGARTIAVSLGAGAGPQALLDGLKAAFDAELALEGEAAARTAPAVRCDDPALAQADVASWLATLAGIVQEAGGKRLVVCIDALEQAAAPNGATASVIDILPDIGQLPPGVVLLLTSRLKEDWPADLYAQAEAKFAAGPAVSGQEVPLDDAAYVDAMRRLFQERLRPLLRARAGTLLQGLLENRASFEKGGRDARLTNDPTLRDALKDDWKKLTNKFPRYSGQLLPIAPLVPLLDTFDQLWVDVLGHGERRFRYVYLIIQRLMEGTVAVEDVAGLPHGADLDARLATPA